MVEKEDIKNVGGVQNNDDTIARMKEELNRLYFSNAMFSSNSSEIRKKRKAIARFLTNKNKKSL